MSQLAELFDRGDLSASQALRLLDRLGTPSLSLEERLLTDLRELVVQVLKIEAADFSPTRAFMDYGLDSIASTEIGALFAERFKIKVPPTVFFEFQNLQSFCGYLLANHQDQLRARYAAADPVAAPSRADTAPPMVEVPAAPRQQATRPPVEADATPLSIEALWQTHEQALPRHEDVVVGRIAPVAPEPSQALLDAQLEFMERASTLQIIRAKASRIECATYGSGPPLLLLGGLVMQFDVMWRLQLKALGEHYRLIMFHLPGCGGAELHDNLDIDSLTDDLAVLLDQLGVTGPLPVIGYSFGGVLAQAFALAHPQRCAGLCITVSSPFSEGASNFSVLMRELQKSARFMTLNRGWNMPALPAYQKVIEHFDLRSRLGELHCPCRIICGSEDAYQPPAYSRLIAEAMPGAELFEVAGAGHLLGFTHHERYNQLLLEFLQALPECGAPIRREQPGVFQAATPQTLETLGEYVSNGEQGHCAILSVPAAQTALLLNILCSTGKAQPADYRSYFMTSLEESLDAALRLARHHARNRTPDGQGGLLLIDSSGYWQRYFDPLQLGAGDALVPGVQVVRSLAAAQAYLEGATPEQLAAVVYIEAPDATPAACDALIARQAGSGILSIVVEQGRAGGNWFISQLSASPDLIVFGECLAGFQAPVGACLVSGNINNPWLMTPNESYVRHVMTNFGLPLKLAFEHLMEHLGQTLSYEQQRQVRRIAASSEATYEAHLRYGNSGYAKIARMHGFDARFYEARGVRSRVVKDGVPSREIIDCFVNVGTCPRGLNPQDVMAQVVRRHDGKHDYWRELQALLGAETGLPHAVPASSNVTAVEAALTLGLLAARQNRKKLLCFTGGLGFSMVSAASSCDPEFDIFRKPFQPLYEHTVFIDPSKPDAEERLQAELLGGDIAMVWFETIQVDANASRPIPARLIERIERHRVEGGYLVGIDETQTNLVTGRLLHSQALLPRPDIVALGSALCDSLLPMGVVLYQDSVHQQARRTCAARLADLQSRSICQLAAHIALNCLTAIGRDDLPTRAREQGAYFKEQLLRVKDDFPLVKEIRAEGLLLTVELDLAGRDPFIERSFGYLMWGSMLRDREGGVAAAVCPIYNNCLRYLPPLTIEREEIDLIVANLRRALQRGIDGVLQDCVAHNQLMGDLRTAGFLAGINNDKKKERIGD